MNCSMKIILFVIYISSLVWKSESHNLANFPGTFDNETSTRFKRPNSGYYIEKPVAPLTTGRRVRRDIRIIGDIIQRVAEAYTGVMCITPPQPKYGSWYYPAVIVNLKGAPNEYVASGTTIVFTCKRNYKLSTTNNHRQPVTCYNGKWDISQLPECTNGRLCSPIYNRDHYTVTCKNREGLEVPCDEATDGTWLTFKCDQYYEPAPGLESSVYCSEGTWQNTPKCVPVCGKKGVGADILMINGQQVENGEYPWMVALYSSENKNWYENICGGSLLATNVVLTAAHCVTESRNGRPINKNYFRVAAGKYYIAYEDWRDEDTAEYSEIETIVVPDHYKGILQNFQHDIALLKLKTILTLSEVIQPVCFKNLPQLPALNTNDEGWVTGWGYTETDGNPSETLKVVQLPFTDDQKCRSQLDPAFADKYLTPDKMCAGFLNKNTSVCKGDSGGGLVFKDKRYKNRFFVHGLVSIAPKILNGVVPHCNVQQSALFTKVVKHYDWIEQTVRGWTNEV